MCHENVKCVLEDDEESDVGFSGFDCECFCNYNGFQCSESGDTCEGEFKTLSMPRLSILHKLCIKLLDTTDTFMYVSATCNSYTPQLQSRISNDASHIQISMSVVQIMQMVPASLNFKCVSTHTEATSVFAYLNSRNCADPT